MTIKNYFGMIRVFSCLSVSFSETETLCRDIEKRPKTKPKSDGSSTFHNSQKRMEKLFSFSFLSTALRQLNEHSTEQAEDARRQEPSRPSR